MDRGDERFRRDENDAVVTSDLRLEDWDDVSSWLRERRAEVGMPTYRDLVRRVRELRVARGLAPHDAPGRGTVYDCFKQGRRRMDVELLADLGRALGLDETQAREWDAACFAVQNRVESAKVVSVAEQVHHTPHFVGREAELRALGARAQTWVISGLPGVGKTQLAIQVAQSWVHRGEAERILVADLRGYHPTRAPADGAAMLDELLRVLTGSSAARLETQERRRALLARELDRQRCVLLLDDASVREQLAQVLPPPARLPVLVTTRQRCDIPNVEHLHLDPLPTDDALGLLAAVVGESLVAQEPHHAHAIVTRLGNLPLAIDVTGRRIADTPGWNLADHVEALDQQVELLRNPEAVTSAIALSYRRLDVSARRLLRVLASQPGTSHSPAALAAILDAAPDITAQTLSELEDASLVQISGERVELHDLVRVHAAAISLDEDPPRLRLQARGRLLDHYLDGAARAVVASGLAPLVSREDFDPSPTSMPTDGALAWLEAERENLLTLADPRESSARPHFTHALSACLAKYLEVQGLYRDAVRLHHLSLSLAQRAADPRAQARAHVLLGQVLLRVGEQQDATQHLQRALDLVDTATDPDTHASAENSLGVTAWQSGDYAESEAHFNRALATVNAHDTTRRAAPILGNLAVLAEAGGDYQGALSAQQQARELSRADHDRAAALIALSNISSLHISLQEYDEGERAARTALCEAEALGARGVLAPAGINLGVALTKLGRLDEAEQVLTTVLEKSRDNADRHHELGALIALSELALAQDRTDAARTSCHQAGAIARELQLPFWEARHHQLLAEIAEHLNDRSTAHEQWTTAHQLYARVESPLAHQAALALNRLAR